MIKLLNKIKPLAWLFVLIGYFAITLVTSLAADQTVTCVSGGCSGTQNSLFNELSVAPGASVTKSIEIINNHGETLKLAMSVSKNSPTDDDFTKLVNVAVNTDGGTNRFTGSLESFLTSYIDLEKLENGQHRLVEITLSLANVGNEYQGKQAKFSFDVKIDQEVPGDGGSGVGGAAVASSPSPSPLSFAFTPAGLVAGAQTALATVLGESTPSAELLAPVSGSVKGSQKIFWWLWIPLLIILLWLLYRLYKRRRLR